MRGALSAGRGIFLLAAFVVVVLLHLVPLPSGSALGRAAQDAAHAPLFGVFAIVVLLWFCTVSPWAAGSRLRLYAAALAAAALTSVAAELAQSRASRDADLWDVVRSVLGAGGALLAAMAFDTGLPRLSSRSVRAVLLCAAAISMLAPAVPALGLAVAARQRRAAFPRLCDFESSWERRFLVTQDAELRLTVCPRDWAGSALGRVAQVTFHPANYPGIILRGPFPDWTGYDRLAFEVYSGMDSAVDLELRIHDVGHDESFTDRFNRTLRIAPGANRVAIALAEVRAAPAGRSLDMGHIAALVLFVDHLKKPCTLYLDAFRLERD